jgi:hypothetical protein
VPDVQISSASFDSRVAALRGPLIVRGRHRRPAQSDQAALPVSAKVGRLRFEEAADDLENDYKVNGGK